MNRHEKTLQQMRQAPNAVRFADLLTVCEHYFGEARIRGSHRFFKTPWRGEPFVNIQALKGGKAKPYQVRQVLDAISKMEGIHGRS
jgi:predicted RNA binding protein YcfA (HicA-like mRNA interferase family)